MEALLQDFVVRSSSDPLAFATTVGREVQNIDKDVPASHARSMNQFLSVSIATRRENRKS